MHFVRGGVRGKNFNMQIVLSCTNCLFLTLQDEIFTDAAYFYIIFFILMQFCKNFEFCGMKFPQMSIFFGSANFCIKLLIWSLSGYNTTGLISKRLKVIWCVKGRWGQGEGVRGYVDRIYHRKVQKWVVFEWIIWNIS